MSQEFRGLTSEERAALESGLSLASRLADAAPPLTAAHVQDLYDTLSSQYPEYGEGIIAAGLAFILSVRMKRTSAMPSSSMVMETRSFMTFFLIWWRFLRLKCASKASRQAPALPHVA